MLIAKQCCRFRDGLKCTVLIFPAVGVERVGVLLAESSYFATFADRSCCVTLSASVLALSAKKIQKVTINCFNMCNFFSADTSADVSATFSRRFAERMLKVGGGVLILKESQNWQPG